MGFFSGISNFVSDTFAAVNEIVAPVTTSIPNAGRIVSNAVGDKLGTTAQGLLEANADAVDWAQNHPAETATIVAGGYYYGGTDALALSESGTTMTATAESGSTALAPVYDAVAVPVSEIAPFTPSADAGALSGLDLGGAGASPASWTSGAGATVGAGITGAGILAGVNSGLSLASSGAKLALLGKTMDAQQATSTGLTGALAPSPIQTPAGLITATPQGPVTAGPVAQSSGFMGMDNQTLFVIAAGIAAVYYFSKHGK
jgi:hypothetical protein